MSPIKMTSIKILRLTVWGMVAALIFGTALLLIYGERLFGRSQQLTTLAQLKQLGGPFASTTQNGLPFTQANLSGKPSLIFFGFTHCPDVCPTALFEITQNLKALGPLADKLNVVFVTVDPERDTPAQMKLYLGSFDPRIIGLSGSAAQTEAMTRAFAVFAERVASKDGGYTINHTASTYMMGADGVFRGMISPDESSEMALSKIRRLVAG
jgi:protein SCO1